MSRQKNKLTKFYVWGSDSHGQLGLLNGHPPYNTPKPHQIEENVKRMACGQKHILFVNDKGICYSQGSNENGELGIDNKEVQFSSLPLRVQLPGPVSRIYCGLSYSFALLEDNSIYGWGLNQQGILGSSNINISWKPIKINLDRTLKIKGISCGALHCGFLVQDGGVLMCGSNEYGELGLNKKQKVSTPTLLDISCNVVEISCGVFYTLLLDNNGKVYSFGNNKYGQLGSGTKQSQNYPKRIRALENQYVVKVSAGYHSGALTNRGELFIWGSGTFGEYLLPHRIQLPNGNFYVQFQIGGFFGAALDKNGKVYTWGNNSNGELGQGNLKNLKQPTEVPNLQNIDMIYCGHNFVLALSKKTHFRSYSEAPHRIQIQQPEALKQTKVQYPSIQRAVSNFKKTVSELQTKEVKLSVQKDQLQEKLFTLSQDYEKLFEKYELIQRIVSQKDRMIAIYEQQIKQSNIRLVESSTLGEKYHAVVQQNTMLSNKVSQAYHQLNQQEDAVATLNKNIQALGRKNQSLAHTASSLNQANLSLKDTNISLNQANILLMSNVETLKQSNESLKESNEKLRSSQRQLRLQIKNQKHLELEKGVEEIIRAKDSHIEELIKNNERLNSQILRIGEKLLDENKLKLQLETYKQKIMELEIIVVEREEEINQLYQEREADKNVKRFTGFMCSPSERSSSKERMSPIKLHYTNKSSLNMLPQRNNPVELKRIIRQMQKQMQALNLQVETQRSIESKLQHEIQEQIIVSAKLKQDIKQLSKSLAVNDSQLTSNKQLLSKYQSIIELKEQEYTLVLTKAERSQTEFANKQSLLNGEIMRFKQECHGLRQRISIIEERENDSMNIIRAQKRQIQDLKCMESDFDTRTLEYKKLLMQISNKEEQIYGLGEQIQKKGKEIKSLEDVLGVQKQESAAKIFKLQQQLSRTIEIKDKLYKNANEAYQKNSELEDRLSSLQLNDTKSRSLIAKLQQKLSQTLSQSQQYKIKCQQQEVQLLSLKKQLNTLMSMRNELELTYQQTSLIAARTSEQKEQTSLKLKDANQIIKSLTSSLQNKTEQISELKDLIFKKEKQIMQLKSQIQEISQANQLYTQNQSVFVSKMRQLQDHTSQLQRYIQQIEIKGAELEVCNKQLNRKNIELADMLNKAIEHQAVQYKQRIMSEVAHNATIILSSFSQKDQEHLLNKKQNQKQNQRQVEIHHIREFGCEISNQTFMLTARQKLSPSKAKQPEQTADQKYNKLLSSKILENKKKISESASKLCQLLDFKESSGGQVYNQINSRLESMDQQKSVLMAKLGSYVQKLKHL